MHLTLYEKIKKFQRKLHSFKSLAELKQGAGEFDLKISAESATPLTGIGFNFDGESYTLHGNVNLVIEKITISSNGESIEHACDSGFRMHGGFEAKTLEIKILNSVKESLKKI